MAIVPGLYLLSGQALEDSPWNGADFWQEPEKPSPLRGVRWARIYRATLTPMRERLIIFWWSALSILPLPRSLWQENGIFLLIVKFLLKSLWNLNAKIACCSQVGLDGRRLNNRWSVSGSSRRSSSSGLDVELDSHLEEISNSSRCANGKHGWSFNWW